MRYGLGVGCGFRREIGSAAYNEIIRQHLGISLKQ